MREATSTSKSSYGSSGYTENFMRIPVTNLIIDYRRGGYYEEVLIENLTGENIILINRLGERVIPPTATASPFTEKRVVISIRSHTYEYTLTQMNAFGYPAQLTDDGIVIEVTLYELNCQPVFVPDIDALICRSPKPVDVFHPAVAESIEAKAYINKVETQQTVRVYAFDPTGEFNELFVRICGILMRVSVDNTVRDNRTKPRLLIFFSDGNGNITERTIDLVPISACATKADKQALPTNYKVFNNDSIAYVSPDNVLIVGRSIKAIDDVIMHLKDEIANRYTREDLDKRMAIEKEELNSKKRDEIFSRDNKIKDLEFTMSQKDRDINKLKLEKEEADRIASTYKHLHEVAQEARLNDMKERELNIKLSNANRDKSKQYIEMLKIALPIAVPIVSTLLIALSKRK